LPQFISIGEFCRENSNESIWQEISLKAGFG
jgi:hypothetical protein